MVFGKPGQLQEVKRTLSKSQPGILADLPAMSRYLVLQQLPQSEPAEVLRELEVSEKLVVGLGASLIASLGARIEGLGNFPSYSGPGLTVPSTPSALWCWLRGSDRGELVHESRALMLQLEDCFESVQVVDGFQYRDSRDLSGYVDGTENPKGDDAVKAAIVTGAGDGLDGSSFVSVQQWIHDLGELETMTQAERDNTVGRRLADNEELDDAPASAHVKRTAQESFEPEAFVLRRSMPFASPEDHGLVFVAFGASTAAYEAQLRRMVGAEDGIVDGLFRFTEPVTGAHYWCPPVRGNALDLRALGIG